MGQLLMAVESRREVCRRGDTPVELMTQVPSGFEAGRVDALGQLGVGQPHAEARLVPEAERIVGRSEQAAPFANDPLLPLV